MRRLNRLFDDENLRIGTVTLRGRQMLCLFNWTDEPITLSARLTHWSRVSDFWTGALGELQAVTINEMPARSARLLECVNA